MPAQTKISGSPMTLAKTTPAVQRLGGAMGVLAIVMGFQLSLCAQETAQAKSKVPDSTDEVKSAAGEERTQKADKAYNPAGHTLVVKSIPGADILVGKKIVFAEEGEVTGSFFQLFADNGTLVKLSKWRIEKTLVVIDFHLKVEADAMVYRMEVPLKGMQKGETKTKFIYTNAEKPEIEIAEVSVVPTEAADTEVAQREVESTPFVQPSAEELYRIQQFQAMQRQRQLEQQRARYQRQYEELRRQAEYEAAEEANRAVRDFQYNRFP